METDQLIQHLARQARPVLPLPAPRARAMVWLAISFPYVVAIVVGYRLLGYETFIALEARYLFQQLATLATAATAAVAAFCCAVPGRDARIALLPLVPLSLWLASLATEWAGIWLQAGVAGLSLGTGWACLPASILLGLAPGVVMLAMLRKGASIYPRTTVALAALASAALGNLGLRLFNVGDVAVMSLVWHLSAIALLSAIAWRFGPGILPWPLVYMPNSGTMK